MKTLSKTLSKTPTKKHNRAEILQILDAMVEELEGRATQPVQAPELVQSFLRSAKYLRELSSIARGRRSAAYWTRRTRWGRVERLAS